MANSDLKRSPGTAVAVALNGKAVASVTSAATLAIACGAGAGAVSGGNIEWGSLIADVSLALTTNTATVTTVWQGSDDGVTYKTIYPQNGSAYAAVAAAGTGAPVTTAYAQTYEGNPSYAYMRLACVIGVTGSASVADIATIAYRYRIRRD